MAIFAEITENECVICRRSSASCWVLRHYLLSLLSIIFKSDFSMMKFL